MDDLFDIVRDLVESEKLAGVSEVYSSGNPKKRMTL